MVNRHSKLKQTCSITSRHSPFVDMSKRNEEKLHLRSRHFFNTLCNDILKVISFVDDGNSKGTEWGTMACVDAVPYEKGLKTTDYLINPDIQAYNLKQDLINPVHINKTFKPGCWVVLRVVPILYAAFLCILQTFN